jgi:hypothetical protein
MNSPDPVRIYLDAKKAAEQAQEQARSVVTKYQKLGVLLQQWESLTFRYHEGNTLVDGDYDLDDLPTTVELRSVIEAYRSARGLVENAIKRLLVRRVLNL